MSLIEDELNAFRARLISEDTAQMEVLARRWVELEVRLESNIDRLADSIAALRLKGDAIPSSRLYEMERYQTLLRQTRAEVDSYSTWAADQIAEVQARRLIDGLDASQAMIRSSYLEAGRVTPSFKLLPIEAVQSVIGFAGDGSPLFDLLMASYPETAQAITSKLIQNVAWGINPRETARQLVKDGLQIPLKRALVIARTEQVRAYRTASKQQMVESGVVSGWIRRSALQLRTCPACLAADGVRYPLDAPMDDHPNGRCFMQPIIGGLPSLSVVSGKQWFDAQKRDDQEEILGKAALEAYLSGKVQFSQFAAVHDDEVWGPTIYTPSLKAILSVEE